MLDDPEGINLIHRDIAEVKASLATLTERIDRLLDDRATTAKERAAIRADLVDLAKRVDALEASRDRQDGALAMIHRLIAAGAITGASIGSAITYAFGG